MKVTATALEKGEPCLVFYGDVTRHPMYTELMHWFEEYYGLDLEIESTRWVLQWKWQKDHETTLQYNFNDSTVFWSLDINGRNYECRWSSFYVDQYPYTLNDKDTSPDYTEHVGCPVFDY